MPIGPSHGTPRWRRWVVAGVALGLAAILIGAAAAAAATEPSPPSPVPTGPPVDSCPTDVLLPACAPPTVTVTPTLPGIPAPPTTTTSCFGIGCLPTPTTTPTPSAPPTSGGDADSCGLSGWLTDIGDCAVKAINSWFAGIASSALHPLLDLLGQTLLSTPSLESLPQIGPLWANSWQLVLAGYVVLVLLGGILVMTHHSVQTQVGLKEILPRLLVAFCASALSLWVADQAIVLANALSRAVLGQDIDPSQATGALANLLMVQSMAPNMAFTVLLVLGPVALLVGLLVTFVVRAVVTIMLVVAAPLCLACHALPQTDGVARWWWRSFGAVLAIQIAQSLTLVVAIRVFLAPAAPGGQGVSLFSVHTGLLDILVCLALLYILYRIPSWILASLRLGGGRTLVGGLVKGFLMAKTFGALTNHHRSTGPAGDHRRGRVWRPPSVPAGPARIHARSGVEGPRALRKSPSTVTPVRFQQATAQTVTHDLATRHATTAPAATTFQTPLPPRTLVAPPRPASPPPPPTFRTVRPTMPPIRTAAVPPALRFVPPALAAPVHVVHADTAPPPVRFESPDTAAPIQRRARTHTPAPPVFRVPQQSASTAPAPPAPTQFRAPSPPRSSASRGEQ